MLVCSTQSKRHQQWGDTFIRSIISYLFICAPKWRNCKVHKGSAGLSQSPQLMFDISRQQKIITLRKIKIKEKKGLLLKALSMCYVALDIQIFKEHNRVWSDTNSCKISSARMPVSLQQVAPCYSHFSMTNLLAEVRGVRKAKRLCTQLQGKHSRPNSLSLHKSKHLGPWPKLISAQLTRLIGFNPEDCSALATKWEKPLPQANFHH